MFLHCFLDASFSKSFYKYFLWSFMLLSYTYDHEILTVHIPRLFIHQASLSPLADTLLSFFQLQQSLTESLLADVESNKTEVASEFFLQGLDFTKHISLLTEKLKLLKATQVRFAAFLFKHSVFLETSTVLSKLYFLHTYAAYIG